MDNSPPKDAFIFMKVGPHGRENLDQIIERKKRELKEEEMTLWSYGKTGPLHPTTQVQPFAEERVEKLEFDYIEVLMEEIEAPPRYGAVAGTAKSYSVRNNKKGCKDIPEGVCTGAPEHALVLGEINRCDLELDLRDYVVGIGDKKETPASHYLAFRGMKEQTCRKRGADKGCLVKASSRYGGPDAPKAIVPIKYRARLLCPYSVFTFPDKV